MEKILSHQSFYIICRYFRHERFSILSPALRSEILATKVLSLKSYNMKYSNSNLTGLARFSTSPQLGKTFTGTTSSPGLFPKKIGGALGTKLSLGATYCCFLNNIYGLKLE